MVKRIEFKHELLNDLSDDEDSDRGAGAGSLHINISNLVDEGPESLNSTITANMLDCNKSDSQINLPQMFEIIPFA